MNTRKTFCPGRGQKPAFWKRKILNPARPKISNIESSENFAHHESTPNMYQWPFTEIQQMQMLNARPITTPKKPPDQNQSSMSLTVWITWITHILHQKRYRILTSDLDSNSSRHVHLNEHQEDILPGRLLLRKRPKACILETKYWIQRGLKSATSNPAKLLLIRVNTTILSWTKSQHQRSLQTKKKHPWASQSEEHGIHTFCNRKGTGYWHLT